ncbi:MAG TPA: hypothetical protein VHO00_11785 [Actinomycetes bacterium]|jgi:hypothetical protein|nr:hypothetical protein [Actinomycetes bacterium]
MKILVTEQYRGDGLEVTRRLINAGHEVQHCQTSMAVYCSAMSPTGTCVLDDPEVAVVVDARSDTMPLTDRELARICAHHRGIPVIVTGHADSTGSRWPVPDHTCQPADVVEACVEAVARPGPAVRRAVVHAARRAAVQAGVTFPLSIEVSGDATRLIVCSIGDVPVPEPARVRIRTAVHGALAASPVPIPLVQVYFATTRAGAASSPDSLTGRAKPR